MPFHTQTLPNGLQVIGETIPSARSASVGFYVKTGSRDEGASEAGVSHFLEHMAFKGTARRSALDVNLDFDRIGANYNAYTSEETTVFYAAVLPEYLPVAVDILADILRPSLRTEDFETEKQVILEEIKMYEDTPGSMAWDRAKRIYYVDHPLGNTILGSMDSVTALTPERMRGYFDRHYSAPNILVAAAGKLDWIEFLKLIELTCQHWPTGMVIRDNLHEARGGGGVHAVVQATATQQHVLVLGPGPAAESPERYAATVLAMAIGDETGSRLYWELIDPGLVESAACGTDQNQACGLTATTYSCNPEQAVKNLAIVRNILEDVQKNGISEKELIQAKNKVASRVVRYAERPMGRMRSIAGSWMYLGEYADVDVELSRFEAITTSSIRDYLARFPLDEVTVVGYGPLASLM